MAKRRKRGKYYSPMEGMVWGAITKKQKPWVSAPKKPKKLSFQRRKGTVATYTTQKAKEAGWKATYKASHRTPASIYAESKRARLKRLFKRQQRQW